MSPRYIASAKIKIRPEKKEPDMTSANSLLEKEFTQAICHELLPEWKGLDIDISQLSGGITNKLYRIRSEKGDYTVRIYGDKTDLFINREHEAETLQKMFEIGVSSKLIKFLPDQGVTIVEFIDDVIVLSNDHFTDRSLHEKIVTPIRKIHTSGVILKRVFNPLQEVMKMSAIQKKLNVAYPEFDITGTIDRLIKLWGIINIPESDYTACHNDLLADNFLLIKEDAVHKYDAPMYIIDWEYGGMAPKYYDIADMFQEILVSRAVEEQIVRAYCNGEDVDRTLFLIDLFKPFPDIYWFLWSLIQLKFSKITFDYYKYGQEKYENALKNMAFMREAYGVAV